MSEKKVERVKEALEYYQYEPNQFGRGLVKQESNLVGVYFDEHYDKASSIFDESYSLELLKGIENVLGNTEKSLVLISESQKHNKENNKFPRYFEFLKQKKIDGLILSQLMDTDESKNILKQISTSNYHFVYIGKRIYENGSNVYAKLEEYSFNMILKLAEYGHTKILFYLYTGHKEHYKNILKRVKKELPNVVLHHVLIDYDRDSIENIDSDIQKYIKDGECTAISSPGMYITNQILNACNKRKISVPKNVSIISVEHRASDGETLYPKISSYYVPAERMGEAATELLLKSISENRELNETIEFESEYCARDSIARIGNI